MRLLGCGKFLMEPQWPLISKIPLRFTRILGEKFKANAADHLTNSKHDFWSQSTETERNIVVGCPSQSHVSYILQFCHFPTEKAIIQDRKIKIFYEISSKQVHFLGGTWLSGENVPQQFEDWKQQLTLITDPSSNVRKFRRNARFEWQTVQNTNIFNFQSNKTKWLAFYF